MNESLVRLYFKDSTEECRGGELEQREQEAVDDAALPAARLADVLRDELVLAEGLDADLPWSQTIATSQY